MLLFGANNPGKPRRAITIANHVPLVLSADLHVIGLSVAGAGLVAGIAAGFFGWPGPASQVGASRADRADRDRVDQILVVAIGVTIAAALVSTVMTVSHQRPRDRDPAAAGRGAGRPDAAVVGPGAGPSGSSRPGRRLAATAATVTTAATVALAGWLAVGVAEAGYAATWPASPVPVQSVAAWLLAHHQHDGLAAYWQGTETTVASGGRVLVAPVTDSATAPTPGRRRPPGTSRAGTGRRSSSPNSIRTPPQDSLTVAIVRARFGPPAAEYHVGGDVVMIYRYNLLSRLHGRTFPGPS